MSLIPLKQIPCIHLARHVGEIVTPAVGDDHVALGLERGKVVRHLAAEELGRVQRGLVDHHGHALGLDTLHDALHARRAEVVGAGLHREAVHAHHRRGRAGVDELRHLGKHLVGDEVLARAVGVDDGLDQVLRHVLVVGQQLLGVLGQAVAAVAEAGVVVVAANARLQAHALDDLRCVQSARAGTDSAKTNLSTSQNSAKFYRLSQTFCGAEQQHRLSRPESFLVIQAIKQIG